MTRLFACLAFLGLVAGGSPAQTPAPAPTFPSTGTISLQSNPTLSVGFNNFMAYLLPANAGGLQKFNIVQGLGNSRYVSFESVQNPGYFLRHQNCQVKLHPYAEGDGLFASDATFIPVPNPKVPGGWMFQAYAPSWLWLSVTRDNALYAAPNPRYEDSTFVIAP
jgi:hypothetical protein